MIEDFMSKIHVGEAQHVKGQLLKMGTFEQLLIKTLSMQAREIADRVS